MARITTLGTKIRRCRLSVGGTLREMSNSTGYSIAFLEKIEINRAQANIDHITKIKAYLTSKGVSADNMRDFVALSCASYGKINLGWFDKGTQKRLLDIVMED